LIGLAWSLPATQASAQAPFLGLGVYGGVPAPDRHRGEVASVRLPRLGSSQQRPQIVLPLNGLLDYNFYYLPTHQLGENALLPAGVYRIDYLDVFGNILPAGSVLFHPGADFTNGVQVPGNPPNSGSWEILVAPLGVQGTVSFTVGPSGEPRPLKDVTVELVSASTGKLIESAVTNGQGFYSFYYTFGVNAGFLPPGKYLVRATMFGGLEEQAVDYEPDTDLTSIGYYVFGARAVADFSFAAP
jgi:hypothetical protein